MDRADAISTNSPHSLLQPRLPLPPSHLAALVMGEYAVAKLGVRFFLFAFQYDLFQLSVDEAVGATSVPVQSAE